jgi:predicted metal-dependent peptidase
MNELPPHVIRARLQLMLAHPFLASALARLPVINAAAMPWCKTMATDGYCIFVNPSFCEKLTEAEVAGVFAHEVMHAVLGHIDRRKGRSRVRWNIAIDHATNLMLKDFGFVLPANGLFDPQFRGMTAEQIYERVSESDCDGFDLHLEPGDLEGAWGRGDDYPTEDERRRLRLAVLSEMEKERLRRGQGDWPAELSREILLATKTVIPWQHLLARFFSDIRRTDYRLYPFNKKHLWRGIYLPSAGVPGPDHVVLAIDTSGSVSAKDLGEFVAELDRLRSFTDCRLTLLHCDAAVHRVDESTGRGDTLLPETNGGRRLAGGGGTSFVPVFEWISRKMREGAAAPDALIYCTDGMGRFPPRAPDYPVVWILTRGSSAQFPFGQVIRLDSGEVR